MMCLMCYFGLFAKKNNKITTDHKKESFSITSPLFPLFSHQYQVKL